MKNFLRALRFAWPYRGRLLLSVLCALLAAAFWSLNFTAIYPVLKILGSDQNLQEWVNECIANTQRKQVEPLQGQVDQLIKQSHDLENKPKTPERDKEQRHLADDLAQVQSKLESATNQLYHYHVAKKYIDLLFPTSRFQTLTFVLVLVVVAVALKG